MDFLELDKRRFSARQYKADPVEREKLLQVMKAGRLASSARNMQAWHFIVVQDDVQREKVANIYRRTRLRQAPIILVVCVDHQVSLESDNAPRDCGGLM
jgi:nitroreductase